MAGGRLLLTGQIWFAASWLAGGLLLLAGLVLSADGWLAGGRILLAGIFCLLLARWMWADYCWLGNYGLLMVG